MWDWVFGDRADVDQEGLLAERTLTASAPRRPARDVAARADGSSRDDA